MPSHHRNITHPRTSHRVEVAPGSQHIRVEIDGRLVAESRRPLLVHETGLPVRYYLPPDDVDLTLLEPTDSRTVCPYKGVASYWSYVGDGADAGAVVRRDVVWSYLDPIETVAPIKGCLSFYDTVATVTVDGRRIGG
ncbi:DUF427 domain-containing protein [Streptomyces sp. SAJ15]|uniref:DUF427 domain-containing protein n=1 Tax=Streptomyces sp. SAJ15 TaxID=2011095 RepID=UPI0021B20FDA|nr:DUF427 domain-containing protein [Streptomyces sp. SAJ15]